MALVREPGEAVSGQPLTFQQIRTMADLRIFSRDPFRALLAQWLDNGPSDTEIQAQARKNPDRWAQGATMLSRLSGYSDKLEVDVTGEITHLHQLSDLELEQRVLDLDRKLKALPARTETSTETA